MKLGNNPRIIAGILTIMILSLILFAGPVKAFVLGLDTDTTSLTKGGDITFTATLDIENMDKYLPVKELQLHINGPTSQICTFDVDGRILSGCDGMTITPINTPSNDEKGYGYGYGYDSDYGYGYDFGYGYGYGYGYGAGNKELKLQYKITLDTTDYAIGNYESQLKALIGNELFESKDKPTFTINKVSVSITSSSGGRSSRGSGSSSRESNGGGFYFEENLGNDEKDTLNLEGDDTQSGFSRITGAVVGAVGKTGAWVIVIFLVIVIASAITVRQIRKKKDF